MSDSLRILGTEAMQTIFQAADNPFVGLFIGLLATAIIQSSSTTTSATVALVATGALNYDTAIPVIMGANIGTTITTTLVALAFIGQKKKFQRALTTALSHNFFNVILVLLLFPLEYYYGLLSFSAQSITSIFSETLITEGYTSNESNQFSISSSILGILGNGFIALLISFILLVISIKYLAKSIYELFVVGRDSDFNSFFNNPYQSFSFGLLLTAGVQSSSVTTAFAVPVAATGEISVKNIFPFILGANIGTTITAFFATLINSEAALVIAFAHLLFNLIGVAVFLPFAALRKSR